MSRRTSERDSIEVVEVGEWEKVGRYRMARWQVERHRDSKRHPTKTHRVRRIRDFKEHTKCAKQLSKYERGEKRDGKPSMVD